MWIQEHGFTIVRPFVNQDVVLLVLNLRASFIYQKPWHRQMDRLQVEICPQNELWTGSLLFLSLF